MRAREKTSGAIRALLSLAPTTARRLDSQGDEATISLDRVQVGDRLRVRPGDKVPLDGEVLEGSSNIDESMVTGEPLAVKKQSGDRVIGGSINGQGSFIMRADKVGRDAMLSRRLSRWWPVPSEHARPSRVWRTRSPEFLYRS